MPPTYRYDSDARNLNGSLGAWVPFAVPTAPLAPTAATAPAAPLAPAEAPTPPAAPPVAAAAAAPLAPEATAAALAAPAAPAAPPAPAAAGAAADAAAAPGESAAAPADAEAWAAASAWLAAGEEVRRKEEGHTSVDSTPTPTPTPKEAGPASVDGAEQQLDVAASRRVGPGLLAATKGAGTLAGGGNPSGGNPRRIGKPPPFAAPYRPLEASKPALHFLLRYVHVVQRRAL